MYAGCETFPACFWWHELRTARAVVQVLEVVGTNSRFRVKEPIALEWWSMKPRKVVIEQGCNYIVHMQ
jgi:hypothetical protein